MPPFGTVEVLNVIEHGYFGGVSRWRVEYSRGVLFEMKKSPTLKSIVTKSKRPIFVHSSWRTSSTWLWSCFRKFPDKLAYCEIFHECFASLVKEEVSLIGPNSWHSKHPAGAPYFIEYLPLIKAEGGLFGYSKSMAFDTFVPADGLEGNIGQDEKEYVQQLIDHSIALGRQAVLTDTRTLGRIAPLKRTFGGTHLFLFRNLFHQWASYCGQAHDGNDYFLKTIKQTLEANRHDSFFDDVCKLYPLSNPSTRDKNYFMAFMLLHFYLYAHAAKHADVLMDVTRLAVDRRYRDSIRQEISKKCDVQLDLEGVTKNFELSFYIPVDALEFEEALKWFLKQIYWHLKLPIAVTKFMEAIAKDVLAEIDQYRFYASRIVQLAAQPNGLLDQSQALIEQKEIADSLRSQLYTLNETCVRQLANATEHKEKQDALERTIQELSARHERLSADHQTTVEERDALARERNSLEEFHTQLTAKIDALSAERLNFISDREVLSTLLSSMTAERDALAEFHQQLTSRVEALSAEREILISNREELDELLVTTRGERASQEEQLCELTSRVNELIEARALLMAEMTRLTEVNGRISDERDALSDFHATLSHEVDSLRAERSLLVEHREALNEENARLEAERSSLQEHHAALIEAFNKLAGELELIRGERSTLLTRVEELKAVREEFIREREASKRQLLVVPTGTLSRDRRWGRFFLPWRGDRKIQKGF